MAPSKLQSSHDFLLKSDVIRADLIGTAYRWVLVINAIGY